MANNLNNAFYIPSAELQKAMADKIYIDNWIGVIQVSFVLVIVLFICLAIYRTSQQ
jgi:hypothetical protein